MKDRCKDAEEDGAVISVLRENFQKVQRELKENGFVCSERFGARGHKFTKSQGAEGNAYVELDLTNRRIACYTLDPYKVLIRNFEEIFGAELLIDREKADITAVLKEFETSADDVRLGAVVAGGSSRRRADSMAVILTFREGDPFSIDFLENVTCRRGDKRYDSALFEALNLLLKIQLIVKKGSSRSF